MKLHLLIGAVALAMVGAEAMAQCATGSRVSNLGQLNGLLDGNTVCAARGAEKWQEQHRADEKLWDYKRGAGDLIDPTRLVGTWAITGTGNDRTVTHTYNQFGTTTPYEFEVWNTGGGLYNFCGVGGASDVIGATIQTGLLAPCPP